MTLEVGTLQALARVLVISLAAWALLGPPAATARNHRDSPSARELWKDYPLDPDGKDGERNEAGPRPTPTSADTPAPPAAETPTQPAAETPTEPATAASDGDGLSIPLLGLGAAAILAIAALVAIRRRSEGETWPTETHVASPAPAVRPRAGAARVAEIEWHHDAAASRFRVVARTEEGQDETVIAESEPLEWPPASQDAVLAMTRTADELAASVTTAGWRSIEPGEAWYAKRFVWEPAGDAPPRQPDRPPSARFTRDSSPEAITADDGKQDAGSADRGAMTGTARDGRSGNEEA